MTVRLEHANITVSSPETTAAWMQDVFGWHIRWQGEAISGGYSLHVGEADSYLALYCPPEPLAKAPTSYTVNGGLNHIAVVVDDLDAVETRVRAAGFIPGEHHDYEPGRRFYFRDRDNIEFEVVQYDA
ncbi:VOC family protein [Phaeobacter gallaeciensis]|uniref:Glyoxalase/bleomycin resistance protein domain-containing protein n=1 Tax=Phaeobacter gallaeciensis TaxID=60890 RepID=A0AAC9ZB70_9RHOB|nr:VOC family protein [Phaeobacter gallaeciensis]AHD10903.1 Lactoylglutathione lyase [Phaeobacter gallaeciensis DSM 26640]ATE94166.1 glyoxalase/bleomycin resistance protein domain-containing protein [Phaeobacter gallaeciensis]ATE96013.1 glyoxalase/bleomycin resistance protein domain-containing protein [Phaeobacter gallaeciensis]ATF02830.1 glyoxalase/bleomycin resistance protein domain-containing protein [Phaeobacter gallaeciensis]ATF07210.1 glyoxalase/bleomycin resistance protein domain-contai